MRNGEVLRTTLYGMVTRIALLLFDGVDLLDTGGPYEVFLTANRLAQRAGDVAPFEVLTVALGGGGVTAYGGLGLRPDAAVENVADIDVLLVPGAIDIDGALSDQRLIDLVARRAAEGQVVASVCTGAFVLGAAGLLENRPFTTHFEDVAELAKRVESAAPRATVRWVDDGAVVTSGGLSSGIAMSLHLVERYAGRALAEATARQIDYVWTEQR